MLLDHTYQWFTETGTCPLALCAKILLNKPGVKILVKCHISHALDQFLEDLMDTGVSEDEVVRIGGKSTQSTVPLSLQASEGRLNID